MKTASKSILKTKLLEYFREIEETGEELVVTDHNRPVLKISPIIQKKKPSDVFKNTKVIYHEDITKSTETEWGDLD